jgi:hypothetical protein
MIPRGEGRRFSVRSRTVSQTVPPNDHGCHGVEACYARTTDYAAAALPSTGSSKRSGSRQTRA